MTKKAAYRRSSASRASTSSFSDSDDAITPCPIEPPKQPQEVQEEAREEQPVRRRSWRNSQVYVDPIDGDNQEESLDAEYLWRRMLTVQKRFGCYNSARMSAALEVGPESGIVPSKTCLDLLNDSLNRLPDDEKKQVEDYLEHEDATRRNSSWLRRSIRI